VKTKQLDRNTLLIGAILILGFLLRSAGIRFGLPHLYHADEPIVVNHAIAYGTWDFHPYFFRIPPLVSYLLFGVFGLFYAVGKMLGNFAGIQEFEFLFYEDPSSFYLIARLVFGAVLGTATLYALFQVIKKYFGTQQGLLSALFLSVCFLHVRDSHYIYTDIALVLSLVFAFGAFFAHTEGDHSWKAHLLSGVMIGAATAIKYNGVVVVAAYLMIVFAHGLKKKLFLKALFAGVISAAVYFCLNPFSILDFQFFMREAAGETASHGGAGWTPHLFRSLLGSVGLPLFILGFLGMFRGTTLRCPKRRATLAFLAVYYLVLVRWGQPYERYVLPLIPFFLFFCCGRFSQRL